MRVLLCADAATAAIRTADILASSVRGKPDTVLGLATGGTMEPVYARIVAECRAGRLDLSRVTTFNLDEYVGLAPEHPQSYRATMQRLLFTPAGIDVARTHLPRGNADDPAAEAARYDAAITGAGGIDLQLLGIGGNGHIGFNEPTSSLASRTRIKTLTQETVDANARFFGPGETAPVHAITMGIATVLEARHCLLLATGAAKAAAVARMIEGPLGADCPASALQMHPRVTIILDPEAARDLRMIEYYQRIHPNGAEAGL